MINLKKIISCILAIAVMSSFSVVLADGSADVYTEEVNILKTLGIYSAQKNKNEAITQKEFMQITAKIFGKDFDKKYYTQLGILPFSNGKYDEEEPVPYYDALRAMVIITGYDYFAKTGGGFPQGYLKIADECKITDGVKITDESAITRAEAIKIVFNTLDVDMMVRAKVWGTESTYEVKEGENLFKSTFNIYEVKGILETGSELTVTENKPKKGYAAIDSVEYETSLDVSGFIGEEVRAYYRQEKGEDIGKLLYLNETKRNKIIEIDTDDILSYENRKYSYDDSKKTVNAALEIDCNIIYNRERVNPKSGVAVPMIPENGNLRLIDNDGNGKYDVLIINNYNSYVAEYVNNQQKSISVKYESRAITVDDDVKIVSSGTEIPLANIKANDVINVMYDLKGNMSYLVITQNTVKGKVRSAYTEDGYKKVLLDDGNEYKFIKSIEKEAQKIKTGDTVTLYADISGRIAGFVINGNEEMKLGYLVDVKDDDEEEQINFDIVDLNSVENMKIPSSEKIKIDDKTYRWNEVKEKLQPGGGEFIARLIRYRLTADGNLREIDTYVDNNNALRENDDNGLIRCYSCPVLNKETGGLQGYYKQGTNQFLKPWVNSNGVLYRWQEAFFADISSTILYIPTNRKDYTNYSKKTMGDIKNGVRIIEAFRVGNSNLTPNIILWYAGDGVQANGSSAAVNRTDMISSGACIVTKINATVNEEDEAVYEMTLFGENGKTVINTASSELLDKCVSVKKGDIIRYGTDGNNHIIGIMVEAALSDMKAGKGYESNLSATVESRYIYGTAYERFGDFVALVTKDPASGIVDDDLYNFKIDTAQTIVYDAEKGIAEKGTKNDVYDYITAGGKDYSRMYVRTSYGEAKVIFIINNI